MNSLSKNSLEMETDQWLIKSIQVDYYLLCCEIMLITYLNICITMIYLLK